MRDDRNRNAPSRQDSTDINRSNVIVLPSLSRAHCPNRKDLTTFFTNLFRHADQNGIISLRAFFKNGTRDFPLWQPFPTVPVGDNALAVINDAAGTAANTRKVTVFCPPVATFKTADNAKAENLLEGLALSVECDNTPQEAIDRLEAILGPATVVVASGGVTEDGKRKLHGHWRLSAPTRTIEEHQKLRELRELATNLIGADCSNKSVVHPIRWPGSWHLKGKPMLCEIVASNPDAEINVDEALKVLRAETPTKPHTVARGHRRKGALPKELAELIREGVPYTPNANKKPDKSRSGKFSSVVWRLANLEYGIDDIVAELEQYPDGIAKKFVNRLRKQVEECYNDWVEHGGEEEDTRPRILLRGGQIHHIVDEAQAALSKSGEQIYQRGDHMCHPVKAEMKAPDGQTTEQWKLHIVEPAYLTEKLTKVASFQRFDKKQKQFVQIDAPPKVATHMLARKGGWGLPLILGITNTPFLRRDGSLCETPGFDAASGLLYQPSEEFPPIPKNPTKKDAREALDYISNHVKHFPFVTDADRSVFHSGLLTTLDRRPMLNAPLHGFSAPTAGTGKTLLVEIISIIATGKTVPMVAQATKVEEFEKELGTMLIGGVALMVVDNCTMPIDSNRLNAMLTAETIRVRVLGLSRDVETPTNVSLFATGNDLKMIGDLTRRALRSDLNADCERPELRKFEGNLKEDTKRLRPKLVAACLTILRAWHLVRSKHPVEVTPIGSFEDWSSRVREPLVWLGMEDPCKTMAKLRAEDPKRQRLVMMIEQWKAHFKFNAEYSARELIDVLDQRHSDKVVAKYRDFCDLIAAIAMNKNGEMSPEKLGHWLKAHAGRPVNGAVIEGPRLLHGRQLWTLRRVQN
jgi:hypothetical protein